jgi:hypothetical protein
MDWSLDASPVALPEAPLVSRGTGVTFRFGVEFGPGVLLGVQDRDCGVVSGAKRSVRLNAEVSPDRADSEGLEKIAAVALARQ